MLLAEIQVTIARVHKMEQYLDEILAEFHSVEESKDVGILGENATVQSKIETLKAYYDSGLWLHDYECDEQGELPTDLKRGVLAEDTLYNLLTGIDEYGRILNGE